MVKPLTFKGDKPRKRKHRDIDPTDSEDRRVTKPSSSSSAAGAAGAVAGTTAENDESTAEDTSWVSADAPSDISGPVILVLPSDPPTCIACDAAGTVFASTLENLIDGDPATAEPHDVRQVWVATRVAGTEGFSFKGHHGRYLSSDKYGILSATASAISPYESFLVIPSASESHGLFALQTSGGDTAEARFVCFKETPSKKSASGTAIEVRGDAPNVAFETTLRIRMQARFKPRLKREKETRAREKVSRKELEAAVGRRLDEDEVRRLRKARREGNFHEEVLDVRVKGKHDKFA